LHSKQDSYTEHNPSDNYELDHTSQSNRPNLINLPADNNKRLRHSLSDQNLLTSEANAKTTTNSST
jgi:hypothetical protein